MEVDKPSPMATPTSVLSEMTAIYKPYVDKIYSCEFGKILEGIKDIKDLVIGNNKRKANFIVLNAPRRLIYLIQDPDTSMSVKIQATIVLGSLAKGIDTNIQSLLDESIVETVCDSLSTDNLELYEASIRCLRTIIISTENASNPRNFDYTSVISVMLRSINMSTCTQECTCEILRHYCRSREHQDHLLGLDIIPTLANLLEVSHGRVKVKALIALTVICCKNNSACEKCRVVICEKSGKVVVEILIELLAQRQANEVQMYSARCLTYMFRIGALSTNSWNNVIANKVVPCLVRMCDPACSFPERVIGAETLAYLTEEDPNLQRLTNICEQFPSKLEEYFKHPVIRNIKNPAEMSKFKDAMKYEQSLANAGFLAYASLLSNDEDIRKKVVTETLVNNVAEAILSPISTTRIAALKCLLSLSRSIRLLRTTLDDAGVWKMLLKLIQEPRNDMEEDKVLSSILCNMTLEFNPSKNEFRSAGLVNVLEKWMKVDELKMNAVWCFMNMCFQGDPSLKLEILDKLGFDLIRNLATDSDTSIIVRTLALLRNIGCNADEKILSCYGLDIIQACKHVLMTFASAGIGDPAMCVRYEKIRAHTVCVLCCLLNVDEPSFIQDYLQSESELLRLVIGFLSHFDTDLQLAAVTFLNGFLTAEGPTVNTRLTLLIENGALAGLRQLHSTNDGTLYEKVEDTLQRLHVKQ